MPNILKTNNIRVYQRKNITAKQLSWIQKDFFVEQITFSKPLRTSLGQISNVSSPTVYFRWLNANWIPKRCINNSFCCVHFVSYRNIAKIFTNLYEKFYFCFSIAITIKIIVFPIKCFQLQFFTANTNSVDRINPNWNYF